MSLRRVPPFRHADWKLHHRQGVAHADWMTMKQIESLYEELTRESKQVAPKDRPPYLTLLARLEATHRELAELTGYRWLYESEFEDAPVSGGRRAKGHGPSYRKAS